MTAEPIAIEQNPTPNAPETWTIVSKVQIVVNDDATYSNPLYLEFLFDELPILVTETVKNKDGTPIYDTILNKGVDGSNNPITFETYKPRQTQVKKLIRTKKNRFIVDIKDIKIKDSQFYDYFRINPVIYHGDICLQVLEYDGWLPQIIDKTESTMPSQPNTTKITLKTFIK